MEHADSFLSELISQRREAPMAFLSQLQIKKALEHICAFLNTDGGWLVIGHNGKNLTGLPDLDETRIRRLKKDISNRIHPIPLVQVTVEGENENQVLIVNTLKGYRQPYSLDSKYYLVAGGKAVIAEREDISLLFRPSDSNTSQWETLTASEAQHENLHIKEIEDTIEGAKKQGMAKHLPTKPLDFLEYFRLIDFQKVKNGAVLLFGKNPTQFLRQCRVRVNNLPQGKTGDTFNEVILFETNLFETASRVEDYLNQKITSVSKFRAGEWDRQTQTQYPLKAINEAVINALVHRDYGDVSGEVTINIYKDKLEIINSGQIPTDIIEGKNTIKPHHSVPRNPVIAHMFYFREKMEKIGRGLSLIVDQFAERKLKAPEWTFQSGYTTLTLYGTEQTVKLNKRMFRFLESLTIEQIFARPDYESFFKNSHSQKSISEKTARNDLAKMTLAGLLNKIGEGQNTAYIRTSKPLPDITG